MRYGIAARVAGLSLVAGMLGAAATAQANTVPFASQDCTITVNEPLEVKAGEQEVKAVVTAELPGAVTAEFPEQSNLKASAVAKAPEANTVTIKVDASKATAGSHALTLKSGDMSCKGEVRVEGGSTADPR